MDSFHRARSEDEKDTRRRAILEAALEQFAEVGFVAARMGDIAARAGVSKGTIYLYFDSKEALLEALLKSAASLSIDRLEELARSGASPREALTALLALAEHMVCETQLPLLLKIIIAESARMPRITAFYREHVVERGIGALSELLAPVLARDGVDPRMAARLVVAPVLMSAIWRMVLEPAGAEPLDVRAQLGLHASVITRGLGLSEGGEP